MFLGLTAEAAEAVHQNLPELMEMTIGHMYRIRKGIHLTSKVTVENIKNNKEESEFPLGHQR